MARVTLLAWILSISSGYFLLGGHLSRLAEGYDPAGLSNLPLIITLFTLIASLILTVLWALGFTPGSQELSEDSQPAHSTRRKFLTGGLGITAGIVATGAAAIVRNFGWYDVTGRHIFMVQPPYKADVAKGEWKNSTVTDYRRLGRTDVMISDISLGSGSSTGGRQTVDVVREAIDRGINYFDTAPDYSEAGSENRFGEAMIGKREKVFLATKFCTTKGHLGPGTSVEEYMQAVNGSLRRLKTDWVDLVHVHSCDTVDRLLDENVHEAFDRLKEQGKVRFLGVSTHTPDLETVANAAIESDRFDVMMLAYHYGAWPQLADIIDRAAQKDIGVVAMKTLRGAKHRGLDLNRDERDSFTQASFKWVLSNTSVSCLVISLWESGQLDEFLYASGKSLDESDIALLEKYQTLVRGNHCRQHCGECLNACPEGVPINDILRHKMYFEDFGAQKEAILGYARLDIRADACLACNAVCSNACPDGIAIQEQLREAHKLLRLV